MTGDIEEQLTGHDTYRRRLAMSRTVKSSSENLIETQGPNLVASLGPENQESAALQSLPQVRLSNVSCGVMVLISHLFRIWTHGSVCSIHS